VSDDGESSQLTGIEHQATTDQRTAYAFMRWGHNNGPSSRSAFPIFRAADGARMAGFRDWLAVVAALARGEYQTGAPTVNEADRKTGAVKPQNTTPAA